MSCVVYFAEISEFEDEDETEKLLSCVSNEKRQKLKRYHFPIDRKLSLYAELLVRQKATEDLQITNDSIKFSVNEYGKPYLQGYSDFHFNISHTRNALVATFSNDEIGIDIERIKPVDLKIADRFFTSDEQINIRQSENKDIAFYDIWTKKEAYIKYIGKGLSIPLNSFSVLDEGVCSMMKTFQIQEYLVSVCCDTTHELYVCKSIETIIFTEEKFKEHLKEFYANH